MILKLISLFIITFSLFAEEAPITVNFSCQGGDCAIYEKILSDTAKRDSSLDSFQESFKFLLQDERIAFLDYQAEVTNGKVKKLDVRVNLRNLIGEVLIYAASEVKDMQLERTLPFLEGDFDDSSHCNDGNAVIKSTLEGRGYITSNVQCERTIDREDLVRYIFRVKVGETQKIRKIILESDNDSLKESVERRLRTLEGSPWDRVQVRVIVDEINQNFLQSGFFDTKLEVGEVLEHGKREVSLKFKLDSGLSKRFSFFGNVNVTRLDFMNTVQTSAKQGFNTFNEKDYQEMFRTLYESKGFPKAQIEIRKVEGLTKSEVPFVNYYVTVTEGPKAEIGNINFIGNESFSDEELQELFFENGTNLTDSNYLDRSYFDPFKDLMKEKYLAQGFLFVEIPSVEALYNERTRKYDIEVRVNERQQVTLTNIVIKGLPADLEESVRSKFVNKAGTPINIIKMESDLNQALAEIRGQGYLFARIDVKNERDLLSYSANFTEADLIIPFVTENKVYLDSTLVTGNRSTKTKVILRETRIKSGDVITPEALQAIRDRLTVLGLFSEVSVQTFVLNKGKAASGEKYLANLLIQVKERDYGILEVAPGFRTDLGVKLGAGITKNNIFGLDHSLSARAEGNYRLNHSSFDERRMEEGKDMLEYEAKVNYRIPYLLEDIFTNNLTFDVSTSFQLRRFYGFDAYISRVAPQLSYAFNDKWSASLRYQFEHIDQFDATEAKDDDNFTIGGLTPSISLDLRDNPINPRKGAAFSLSWEFANPAFGSMSTDDITINFSKMVQRNKFYIPFSDRWYLASSISWGYQKNYADEYKRDSDGNLIYDENGRPERKGYIPSLKVFRLDGIDVVRGFADNEINRLENEDVDIGDVIIDETAYFANVKIEPRYVLSDNVILGLFFDAGRVFRRHFQVLSLRTSSGVTMKLMTPVGSLDFDYGVKLHRANYDRDKKETFGRFHLTIGFF